MRKYLDRTFGSIKFQILLTIFFIGPISRWWSAIENNRTILDAGRISLGYLIISLLISFFAILFLSFIPDFLNLTRFKFLGIISFTLYILFLAIGLGSFLSSFSLFAENSFILYFLTALFVLLILLSEKFIDFNSLKKIFNFLFLVSIFAIIFPLVLLVSHYLDFGEPEVLEETNGKGNVLIIIFDEMSFSYYEESANGIPSFMENLNDLSRESTVYTKTSTTYPFTELAIPSMLAGINSVETFATSGESIEVSTQPLVSLMSSHRIYSQLGIFDLCKALNCKDQQFSQNLYSSTFFIWFMDFIAVGGNILPKPIPEFFPTLEGTWRNYWEFNDLCFNCYDYLPNENPDTELTPRDSDGYWFYLYHDLVTHHAWNLDSEGKAIQPKSTQHFKEYLFPECINPWRVLCSEERIALRQEVYKNGLIEADRRIGEFVEFLKKTNQYEQTMILVTADHGIINDGEGDGRRPKAIDRFRPLAHVPLVIKYPGQSESKIINEVKSTGQIISTIVKTVGDESLIITKADLNDPIPNGSSFSTEGGDIIVSMKSIFEETSSPKQVKSELKISPWKILNEISKNYKEIIPTEGIVGYGEGARSGPSETAVMAWFADLSVCFGDVIVEYKPNGNLFYTIFDSLNTEGLIWSLVKREKNMDVEDFSLYCVENE